MLNCVNILLFAVCVGKLLLIIVVTVNVALQRPAVQSSTFVYDVASLAVDGNLNTVSCTEMLYSEQPWWSVDLGTPIDVGRVCVVNDHDPIWG